MHTRRSRRLAGEYSSASSTCPAYTARLGSTPRPDKQTNSQEIYCWGVLPGWKQGPTCRRRVAGEYSLARHAHNISGARGWGVLPGLVEHQGDIVAFYMQGWGVLPGPAMAQDMAGEYSWAYCFLGTSYHLRRMLHTRWLVTPWPQCPYLGGERGCGRVVGWGAWVRPAGCGRLAGAQGS